MIYKGILHRLLAPTNKQLSEIDMEVFVNYYLNVPCGDMLHKVDTESYDKYIKILIDNSKSFGDNIIELVEDLNALRVKCLKDLIIWKQLFFEILFDCFFF